MRKALLIIAAWLPYLAVAGQAPDSTSNPPSQQQAPLCMVEGLVTEATTGAPVKKAVVRIYSLERNWDHATVSDSEGRFIFRDVPPGRYRLQAEGAGYLGQAFGEQNFGDGGAEVRLEPGEHPRDIRFHLTPAGVISGTVRDEDGLVVMQAAVSALQRGYFDNRYQLFPSGSAQTDDRGQYRIYPLRPGRYTVMVNHRRGGEDRYATYLPTYYPGTADPNEAGWIDVAPGQEVLGIDVQLTSARAACVRGRVTNLVPSKNSTVPYIQLLPVDTPLADQLSSANYAAPAVNDQGEFQICGVPPGAYFADANYQDGEKHLMGRARVEVAITETNEVDIPLALPFDIRGRVRTDSQGPFDFPRVQVWLRSTDKAGGGAGGKMNPDGTFMLQDVFEGDYRLQIAGFPEEFYVKSAQWGGADVLPEGLAANQTQSSQLLEILLSVNGARIDGTVTSDHKPVPGVTVAFVPDAARRQRDELYSLTRTDAQGRFSLLGLPPGEFTLYAFEKIDGQLLKNPDFLQRCARFAKAVHLGERERQTVDLELVPSRED